MAPNRSNYTPKSIHMIEKILPQLLKVFQVALAWGICHFLLVGAADSLAATKTDLLKDKLAAMETLRGQIGLKLIEASAIRNRLQGAIDPLMQETKTLIKQHRLTEFPQTGAYPQIKYGLKTLAYLQGYFQAIQQAIAHFRQVDHELQYLIQQVRDDLRIISTLNDFTIDSLIAKIDRSLNFPNAHQPHLLEAQRLKPPAPEALFNAIRSARNTDTQTPGQ